MLEPIQGEAGVWAATDQFLRELRALTKQHGLLLIFDEIQTGMGRTGKLFHYEHAGIEPDIMTLGKGIGGGVPLAALLATEHASCFEHGDQGGTFNGNPLMCAAGLAVLEQVASPAFLKATVEAGLFLESELQRLSARHGLGEVRGRGLLLALDLKLPIGASIVAQAFEDGLLLNSPQPDALRFMPALNVTREEIGAMIDGLDTILTKVGAARWWRSALQRHCEAMRASNPACCNARIASPRVALRIPGMTFENYGRMIAAPVVARPSRSICALAASFRA